MPEPRISYPPELPVSAAREEIAAAIRDHQVVIVAGATGSGKTTQLPKILLELGRTSIVHTQPRRIAARSIAERIASELDVPLGSTVGYRVRFTDKVSADTRVALVTDGILLAEIHRDRLLRRYDAIIVDEAHERSLNVDFLLGYLARILPQRPDLKLVVTSATIDPESFARHFGRPSSRGSAPRSGTGEPDSAARSGTGEPGSSPRSGTGEPGTAPHGSLSERSTAPHGSLSERSETKRDDVPIVEVSGRTYPVEIRYRPALEVAEGSEGAGGDDVDGIVRALRELDREPDGDVLVFLPGEAEIRDAADAVRGMYASNAAPTEVLPLYGRLSAAEQHRVFERSTVPGVRRRVILATNVAETSLTVPGIRYVVDTGTARISRYSARSKVQQLPIEAISQASAQQRSGRAGRTAPGIAIRLYSEEDFDRRPEFTEPEILRTSLAAVVLQMLALGFGDIRDFPFLTPPDSRGVAAAFDLLVELGAVAQRPSSPRSPARSGTGGIHRAAERAPRDDARLTDIGRAIARLPIEPRFARMLVEATRTGVRRDVLAIVAGLSIQDVRERPEERREEADRLHARFTDPTSDFLSLLNLWNHLREQQDALGSSAFRRLCRAEHLNYVRVREWFDVHRQLAQLLGRSGPAGETTGTADPDVVHRAILSGLLSHLGILDQRTTAKPAGATGAKERRPRAEYRGARGAKFAIFPGSGLRKSSPPAVMAAELVETSRLYARTVAVVDPEWAEDLAGDLVKRQLSDPHWSKDAGAAVASEKVTLFGVEIVPRRRVQLARFDRPLARELFVRHALVEGEWDTARLDKRLTGFTRRNLELRRRLEKREERERRRDILVGDEAVFGFYDGRIPADVVDIRSFEAWWRDASEASPDLLDLRESDLVEGAAQGDDRHFPARWQQGDQVLSLAYRFEPGAADDGVTVVVPLALLAQLEPVGFDWQVPGMRDELIAALIRSLPKQIRRNVVPAADWAATFAEELADDGPESHTGRPPWTLRAALAARIQRVANQPVSESDFDLDRVPGHLLPSFRAVDGRGRAAGSDRDLRALQARLADRARASVERAVSAPSRRAPVPEPGRSASAETVGAAIVREGLTEWTLDALPEVVDTKVAGGVVRGYPALVDEKTSVAVRIESTPEDAVRRTRAGIRRLLLLAVPSPAGYVLEHLTANEKLALAASPYPSAKALVEDARAAVAEAILTAEPDGIVRTAADFARVRDAYSAASVDETFRIVSLAAAVLLLGRDVERSLKAQTSIALLGALGDVRGQLAALVFDGFLSRTGTARLAHLPRYLRGILQRLDGLADNPGRDRARLNEYERAAGAFVQAGGTAPPPPDADPRLVHVRWLLEEYRVSLFAQSLGTAEPVSPQRIAKALQA